MILLINSRNVRTDIVSDYNNYKSKMQNSDDECVLHQADKVTLTGNMIGEEIMKPSPFNNEIGGRTFLLKDSHVDNNSGTDDVIKLEYVKYDNCHLNGESRTRGELKETFDGDRQVIIEKHRNLKGSVLFTKVDKETGYVIDKWRKNETPEDIKEL